MLYRAVRPFLFALDPETAHRLGLKSLDILARLGASSLVASAAPRMPVRVMGLDFPNPVGLAAGLDKDGEHIDALAALGFGFIEVGAVMPPAQGVRARELRHREHFLAQHEGSALAAGNGQSRRATCRPNLRA